MYSFTWLRWDAQPTTLRASMRGPLFLSGPSTFAAAGLVSLLAGCAAGPVDPAGPTDAELTATASPNATAIVVVEGVTAGESASDGAHTDVVARFLRARSGVVDDDARRMVGATVDFPAIGGCGALSTPRAPAARAISLVDVGGVTLSAGESVESGTALQRRQLPDVADLISGVVYSATARDGALPSKGSYLLRVEGSADGEVTPFSITASSPGEPLNVRLEGDDGHAGAITLPLDASVELTWDAGAGDDLIYVDVGAISAAPVARCLFVDSGEAKLGTAAFGPLEDGTVTVHRMHRESFHAHGVDPGEVRFDFARVVPFSRR